MQACAIECPERLGRNPKPERVKPVSTGRRLCDNEWFYHANKKYLITLLYKIPKMSLLDQVEAALDTIRPYLLTDGGNVSIEEITPDNVVKLKLLGACGSCPMSIMTLKAGIEEAIKKAVPEITGVEAVNLTDIDDPNAVLPENLR